METINANTDLTFNVTETKSTEGFWEAVEYNRFSLIVVALGLMGCLGGIAAAYAIGMSTVALMLVVFAGMSSLTTVLAVAPMRIIAICTAFSVLVNLTIIALGIFA